MGNSLATYLVITNDTQYTFRITVSETDNYDWDGDSRPDINFQGIFISPGQILRHRAELNINARSSMFRMTFTAHEDANISFSFRADQRKCHDNYVNSAPYPLEGASVHQFHALHCCADNTNFFTITTVVPSSWMRYIHDDAKVASLTIPGTHDSATFRGATGINTLANGWVMTQNRSISEQLFDGIRFLDIRCRHIGNGFTIHHGAVYVGLDFGDVLYECREFLRNNPTETIFILVKPEHTEERCSRSFKETFLAEYVHGFPWFGYNVDLSTFTMGEARGKLILLSRDIDLGFGAHLNPWWDNNISNNANFYVQDIYAPEAVNKVDMVVDTLNLARNEHNRSLRLFINFVSRTGDNHNDIILSRIPAHIGRYGIVVMDFYTNDLVHKLIASNASVADASLPVRLANEHAILQNANFNLDANADGQPLYMSEHGGDYTSWRLLRVDRGYVRIFSSIRQKWLDASDAGYPTYLSNHANDYCLWYPQYVEGAKVKLVNKRDGSVRWLDGNGLLCTSNNDEHVHWVLRDA